MRRGPLETLTASRAMWVARVLALAGVALVPVSVLVFPDWITYHDENLEPIVKSSGGGRLAVLFVVAGIVAVAVWLGSRATVCIGGAVQLLAALMFWAEVTLLDTATDTTIDATDGRDTWFQLAWSIGIAALAVAAVAAPRVSTRRNPAASPPVRRGPPPLLISLAALACLMVTTTVVGLVGAVVLAPIGALLGHRRLTELGAAPARARGQHTAMAAVFIGWSVGQPAHHRAGRARGR